MRRAAAYVLLDVSRRHKPRPSVRSDRARGAAWP